MARDDLQDETLARAHASGQASIAIFALGMTSGMLVLMIAFLLLPEPEDPAVAEFEAVRDFTRRHFVRELGSDELVTRALSGMLDGLDPYSRYYDDESSERARREIEGDFRGIGVVFRSPIADGQVLFPLDDSPASRGGVRVGDRLVRVDGEPVAGRSGPEVRALLAARGRDRIVLDVEGLDGVPRTLTVEPDVLLDPTVRHAEVLDGLEGAGYLAVRSFSHRTATEFDAAVLALREQGVRTLVVDLRFNLGGVLDAAVHMASRFIDEGVIVSSEGRARRDVREAGEVEARFQDMGLVVLVDGDTASASEVFAGAIQDHRRGVVVGAPTYGKGMIQLTQSFPEFGSRAKVTSGYYYSPSHRNFERSADPDRTSGILPDLLVEIDPQERARIHGWIARYDPPLAALDALFAWDAAEDGDVLPRPPEDHQLEAVRALLRGEHPGPAPRGDRGD
ncbi:MAG: S41 family peptidase [Planctomycetota bacterium]